MPEQPLQIEDLPGTQAGTRILSLTGPLTLSNVFGFQSQVRADESRSLILDFTNVPWVDSAGIGALVGAYVSRERAGRLLRLVGVNQRIRHALEVTRVESFFHYYGTVTEAEQAAWAAAEKIETTAAPQGTFIASDIRHRWTGCGKIEIRIRASLQWSHIRRKVIAWSAGKEKGDPGAALRF